MVGKMHSMTAMCFDSQKQKYSVNTHMPVLNFEGQFARKYLTGKYDTYKCANCAVFSILASLDPFNIC